MAEKSLPCLWLHYAGPVNSGVRPLMSDGDIDYSKFTLRELEEALAGINRQRYPKNFANLRSAYEQRTGSMPVPLLSAPSVVAGGTEKPDADLWDKFWGARPVLALCAVASLWWAYEILSDTESCPSGGRLMRDLVQATCENFGHVAAAGIPFALAVVLVALAMRPSVRSGA